MTRTTLPAAHVAVGSQHTRRGTVRRAETLPGAMGVTFLGAIVPGAGLLWTRRVLLGLLVLLPSVTLALAAVWLVGRDTETVTAFVFDPARLKLAATVVAAALAIWFAAVVATYALARPRDLTRLESGLGAAFVLTLCVGLAAPVVVGARYAWVQADLVETVFEDNLSATTPDGVTQADPWAGHDRVNVLLLGGDANVRRDGVRTDSMILTTVDTATGETVTFSLPRNLMRAQFPEDSALAALYPDGYSGDGDPAAFMLNAVYGQVPALHPGILGESDNEGADALKEAVAGSLGIDVDYYVLVNLLGFRELVDAIGGVTVNVNTRVPIGGDTDRGVPPEGYLEPGPDQRLDGFEALWFARGRYGSDDYARMERQRCLVDAIVDETRPWTLLRRYQALAATGKEIVRTDIPSELMPAFVDLALEVQEADVRSVVFRRSEEFSPADPDFDWMRSVARRALAPPSPRPGRPPSPSPATSGASPSAPGSPTAEVSPGVAVDSTDACAYRPDDAG
jgi:polyisoprenyl-teichoic acid--peptidoglycan teichoic acid transferase